MIDILKLVGELFLIALLLGINLLGLVLLVAVLGEAWRGMRW